MVDPLSVKTYALRAAGEMAEAILRVRAIIRARDEDRIRSMVRVAGSLHAP